MLHRVMQFVAIASGSGVHSQSNTPIYEQLALDYFCDSILQQDSSFMYAKIAFSGVVSDEPTFLQHFDVDRFGIESSDVVYPDSLMREANREFYRTGEQKPEIQLDAHGRIPVKPDAGVLKRTEDAYVTVHFERVLRGRHFIQIKCDSRTSPSSEVIVELSTDGRYVRHGINLLTHCGGTGKP